MHRNQFLFCLLNVLLCGCVLAACTSPEDKQPDNLIPEPKMATILTQIHLAEASVSRIGLGASDSSNIVYKRLEKQIFQKFKVDTSSYNKSYAYYALHPRQMEAVYKQIVENLKKKTEQQQKQLHTKKPAHP